GPAAAPRASSRPQPARLRERPVWVPHRSASEPATAFVAAAPNSATDRSNPNAPSETPNDALMSDAETAHAPQKNPKQTNPAATARSDPRTAINRACHHRIFGTATMRRVPERSTPPPFWLRTEACRVYGIDPQGYDAGRPEYPERVYELLQTRCGVTPGTVL